MYKGDDPKQDPLFDNGIVINGVKWATRNVDTPGTFATKPEAPGMYYQWNRKKAWSVTDDVTDWNTTVPEGTEWTKANDTSPAGWRVPTSDEIQSLFDTNKVSNEPSFFHHFGKFLWRNRYFSGNKFRNVV